VVSPELVVGVDGGNSKTDVAIADLSGQILGRSRGDGTRAPDDGAEHVAAHLANLIAAAKAQAARSEPLAAAVFYLANLDLPEEEREMEQALAPYGLSRHLVVGNDTLAVLRAGTDQGWGVAIVLGAGINGIGVAPTGQVERYLAIGQISGDWGGGMGLAVASVGAAMRCEDGRGPATSLAQRLPEHFGLINTHQLVIALHRNRVPWSRLHELVPVLLATADAGDPVARDLVTRQGREIACMASALIRRLGLGDTATPVILGGGVGQSRNRLLMDTLTGDLAESAPLARVQILDQPPVAGAVAAALDLAGADQAAVHRARTHDWAAYQPTRLT